ncbi:uncharacterized protein LOC126902890 isoform X2 [Daktulosphaira vitifoliae]|uniref:uncharacterized protein LOC126902890 isoform X2 n=1 Tax=Daktulosphaira vitifoliae TaxID=58002 RepID=UPI0021A9D542|nr:uncharacterized protein LOC126902890 isoform X2 [Daktulosphaira vitifoliae]
MKMSLLFEDIFELNQIVKVENIVKTVSFQTSSYNIFAIVLSNDIILFGDNDPPSVKWLPWPKEYGKKIVSLAFKSSNEKLLLCSFDCTLYLVFVRELFEPKEGDRRNKVKIIRPAPGEPTSSLNPTAVTWWTPIVPTYSSDIGIVGGNIGEIVFVNLRTGACLGSTCIKSCIKSLEILHELCSNTVWLIISSNNGDRWKLLLENLDVGYCWLNPKSQSSQDKESNFRQNNSFNIETIVPVISNLHSTRARLLGLRQLFLEKLSVPKKQQSIVNCIHTTPNDIKHPKRSLSSESITNGFLYPSTGPAPEPMASVVSIKSRVQYHRNKQTFVSYASNHVLVHASGFNTNQPLVFKLLKGEIEHFLYTDQYIYTIEEGGAKLNVYFSNLCQLKSDSDDKKKSLIGSFKFDNGEIILDLFRIYEYKKKDNLDVVSSVNKIRITPNKKKKYEKQQICKKVDNVTDLCAIITNHSIYYLNLRIKPEEIILKYIMEGALDLANDLCEAFDLDIRPILEKAADEQLSARKFEEATLFYKLSKTNPLKRVLRLASLGNTDKVILFVSALLEQAHPKDLTALERLHISNLAVMSYAEQLLRANNHEKIRLETKFLCLLSNNHNYDEALCVNIVGQSRLFNVLRFLAVNRGLHNEVLTVLISLMNQKSIDSRYLSFTEGFWSLVSDLIFTEALVANNKFAKVHASFIQENLLNVTQDVVLELKALYDPSNPALRPVLRKIFKPGCELDYSIEHDNLNQSIKEWFTTYIMILIKLSSVEYSNRFLHSVLLSNLDSKNSKKSSIEIDNKSSLGAGWAHAAHIRNHKLYTWGHSSNGCLGIGPHMSKTATPNPVSWFVYMGVEVIQVACGRNHSIALTTNGVFSWGSNRYGQLGTARKGQAPYPMLVESMSNKLITCVSTGQYHSLAVSVDGKLWTWGWGVYGQLGHGSIDDCEKPKILKFLGNEKIINAFGGYAHSIVLSNCGKVFTFGSGVFGQLGNGSTAKITSPVPVYGLPESIKSISTAYFHNLALSDVGRLYTWGSSPQVLRFHAQTQKRARQQLLLNEGDTVDDTEIDALTADDGLLHLSPTLVDTSNIKGEIIQMCCGCHHSAIISSTGQLYTWGLNLDGQLGVSGIKERLIPAITLIGPPSAMADSTCNSCQSIKEVKCGADFTLALDSANKLWGWGSNHEGQLGKIPEEDLAKTLLDGKMVMIKSTHKVIKIQHGNVNKIDSPIEIILPQLRFSFSNTKDIISISVTRCINFPGLQSRECVLENLNDLSNLYGIEYLLHYVLEWFYPYYHNTSVISKCIAMKNCQGASKVSFISNNPSKALFYQFEALVQSKPYGEIFGFDIEDGLDHSLGSVTPNKCFSLNLEEGELFNGIIFSKKSSLLLSNENINKEWPGLSKISQIFNYYYDFIHKDDVVFFLHEYLTYWLTKSFPIDPLEQLFLERWDKIKYPLGTLLLSNSKLETCSQNELNLKLMSPKAIMQHLSVSFCMHLCSSISKIVNENSKIRRDFVNLFAHVTNAPSTGRIDTIEDNKTQELLDHSIHILSSDEKNSFIHIEFNDAEVIGDSIIAYSCGHRYLYSEQFDQETKKAVNGFEHLTKTTSMIQSALQKIGDTACPNCVSIQINSLLQND